MPPSSGTTPNIVLQQRDIALLRGFLECRVMTTNHASDIHFNGKREMAKKRLQKLKAAGFIGERKRHASAPAVLFLTRKGVTLLQDHGVLAEYPAFDIPALERRARVGALTLAHELEVMAVKAAFHSATHAAGSVSVSEFTTWPLLNQFTAYNARGEDTLVKPDGFIRLADKAEDGEYEHSFYLELDRSTETQDVLVERVACYMSHYRFGGYAERCGASRDAYKEYPFRVLFVLKSAERRNNLIERLLQESPPVLTFVWLTTLSEAASDPLGAIWMRPVDYQRVLAGTPFAVRTRPQQQGHRRRTARDALVDNTVPKTRLRD